MRLRGQRRIGIRCRRWARGGGGVLRGRDELVPELEDVVHRARALLFPCHRDDDALASRLPQGTITAVPPGLRCARGRRGVHADALCPRERLEYRTAADATLPAPAGRLDPGLPVAVVQESTGWARVRCSNGWETWVDGRALVADAGAGGAGVLALTPTTTTAVAAGGAVVALVGTLLAWFSAAGTSVNAWDFDLVALFDHEFADDSPITPGLTVLVLAALAVAVVVFGRPLPRLAVVGLGTAVVLVGALGLGLYYDLPGPGPISARGCCSPSSVAARSPPGACSPARRRRRRRGSVRQIRSGRSSASMPPSTNTMVPCTYAAPGPEQEVDRRRDLGRACRCDRSGPAARR